MNSTDAKCSKGVKPFRSNCGKAFRTVCWLSLAICLDKLEIRNDKLSSSSFLKMWIGFGIQANNSDFELMIWHLLA